MSKTHSKTAEESAAAWREIMSTPDYKATMATDPTAGELGEVLTGIQQAREGRFATAPPDVEADLNEFEYTYPAGSERDESRLAEQVSDCHSNRVMRGVYDEAAEITTGDRNANYGPPEENHSRTAEVFNWYIKHKRGELNARDITWLNVLQKISRDIHLPRRDNSVDVCGFAGNGEACRIAELPVNGT